jgi:sulfide:quinone oxidoreductase
MDPGLGDAPPAPARAHTRALVVGGGVAALETLLALRVRTGGALRPTLLAPDTRFRHRPLAAYAGLVPDLHQTVDLVRLAAEQGGGLVRDRLVAVDTGAHEVATAHGARIGYDALVVATGVVPRVGLPGALTLGDPRDESALARLVARVRAGETGRLAVVVPPGVLWSLPAYELALLLRHAAPDGRTEIAVFTAEDAPMIAAGADFGAAITGLLDRNGVELHTATWPDAVADGHLWLPLQGASRVDGTIALARLVGPSLPGLPSDEHGLLPVGEDGRVLGQRRVWAAGDVAAHPSKQGRLAVQQADVVADGVARHLGLERLTTDGPPPAVLRAALLDGEGTLYLCSRPVVGGFETQVSREPLWWPPSKIAGGRLPAHLAEHEPV